jgi:hypothetical protein
MKYKEAKEIGLECGLQTAEEHIGNIEYHSTMLFEYSVIETEIEELYQDAYALGVTDRAKMEQYHGRINDKLKNL